MKMILNYKVVQKYVLIMNVLKERRLKILLIYYNKKNVKKY